MAITTSLPSLDATVRALRPHIIGNAEVSGLKDFDVELIREPDKFEDAIRFKCLGPMGHLHYYERFHREMLLRAGLGELERLVMSISERAITAFLDEIAVRTKAMTGFKLARPDNRTRYILEKAKRVGTPVLSPTITPGTEFYIMGGSRAGKSIMAWEAMRRLGDIYWEAPIIKAEDTIKVSMHTVAATPPTPAHKWMEKMVEDYSKRMAEWVDSETLKSITKPKKPKALNNRDRYYSSPF